MYDSMAFNHDLDMVRRRYRWLAHIYPFLELVFLLPRGIRNKAVERVGLTAGTESWRSAAARAEIWATWLLLSGPRDGYMASTILKPCWGERRSFATREVGTISRCCKRMLFNSTCRKWSMVCCSVCAIRSCRIPWCSSTSVEVSATW